jgi:hypothetical protein
MDGGKKEEERKMDLKWSREFVGGGAEMGDRLIEGVFMAEGNLLGDDGRANERQKLDWASLIFHDIFFSVVVL